MTRAEAVELLEQIGDRLDAVLKHAAAALPDPEYDEAEINKVLFDGSAWAELNDGLRPAVTVILRVEPLISFVETHILPIINSSKVEELAQFKQRKGKQYAA